MVNIIQGQDKTLQLTFKQDLVAWPLTGNTAISVTFPGPIVLTLSSGVAVIDEAGGIITATLTKAQTALLPIGNGQGLQIVVDFGAVRKIFEPDGVFNVRAARY